MRLCFIATAFWLAAAVASQTTAQIASGNLREVVGESGGIELGVLPAPRVVVRSHYPLSCQERPDSDVDPCRISINAEVVWQQYGLGSNLIRVLVLEAEQSAGMQSILMFHPAFWHKPVDVIPFFVPTSGERLEQAGVARRFAGRNIQPTLQEDSYCKPYYDIYKVSDNPICDQEQLKPRLGEFEYSRIACSRCAKSYPSFALENSEEIDNQLFRQDLADRSRFQHELEMLGLISGQMQVDLMKREDTFADSVPYMILRTGLSPGTDVALIYSRIDGVDDEELDFLSNLLDRRTRVLNFSVEYSSDLFSKVDRTATLDAQYQQIYRWASFLAQHNDTVRRQAARGFPEGRRPADVLFVAASGNNQAGFAERGDEFVPDRAPVVVIEDLQKFPGPVVFRDISPVHAALPVSPNLPLLVVGAISFTDEGSGGQSFQVVRAEPTIDLFAPAGTGAFQSVREIFGDAQSVHRYYFGCSSGALPALMEPIPEAIAHQPISLDWLIKSASNGELNWLATLRNKTQLQLRENAVPTQPCEVNSGALPALLKPSIGVSGATALVSAAAALVLSIDPGLTAIELRDLLRDTAKQNIVRATVKREPRTDVVAVPVLDLEAAARIAAFNYVHRGLRDLATKISAVPLSAAMRGPEMELRRAIDALCPGCEVARLLLISEVVTVAATTPQSMAGSDPVELVHSGELRVWTKSLPAKPIDLRFDMRSRLEEDRYSVRRIISNLHLSTINGVSE